MRQNPLPHTEARGRYYTERDRERGRTSPNRIESLQLGRQEGTCGKGKLKLRSDQKASSQNKHLKAQAKLPQSPNANAQLQCTGLRQVPRRPAHLLWSYATMR